VQRHPLGVPSCVTDACERDIRGFISLLMDLPSIDALKKIVRDFIDGIERQSTCNVE
jgi:hypothetical protein